MGSNHSPGAIPAHAMEQNTNRIESLIRTPPSKPTESTSAHRPGIADSTRHLPRRVPDFAKHLRRIAELGADSAPVGSAKYGWFSALNISARNCSFGRSNRGNSRRTVRFNWSRENLAARCVPAFLASGILSCNSNASGLNLVRPRRSGRSNTEARPQRGPAERYTDRSRGPDNKSRRPAWPSARTPHHPAPSCAGTRLPARQIVGECGRERMTNVEIRRAVIAHRVDLQSRKVR